MSSRKRPAPVKKKVRNEAKQPEVDTRMKKILVLKPVVLDFDFGNEGGVHAASAESR